MEGGARSVAKEILSEFMSNDSMPSSNDVSLNELEHLAELHKQIELKKAYRDTLRGLNLGLFALKQGISRAGNDPFAEWLVKEQHATVRLVADKQREASYGTTELSHEPALLGSSRQVLVEQAELQKLQSVVRLQDQVRAKLASTRVVKQWEREKATLLTEQNELSKLDVVGEEIMQKRKKMLVRKHAEIATLLIGIGESVERTEELRSKLAEFTKQRRDELHDFQSSDSDMRSEEGRKDGRLIGENGRDGSNCPPLFDTIDWNLGSVSMDLRLDIPFKNPNDFPDILTRLSSINTNKYQLKDVSDYISGKSDNQSSRQNTPLQKASKMAASGKKRSPELAPTDATVDKKSKMSDSSEKPDQKVSSKEHENGNTNAATRKNPISENGSATPKPLSKKNSYDKVVTNGQHKLMQKTPAPMVQRDPSPGPAPKASSTQDKRSSPTEKGTGQNEDKKLQENRIRQSVAKSVTPGNNNNRTTNNQSKGKMDLPQRQHCAQQEKGRNMYPKQIEQMKKTRSMRMLSPAGGSSNSAKNVKKSSVTSDANNAVPPPVVSMEMEPEEANQGVESSPSNSSLDFGIQSSSGEFDINFSGDLQLELNPVSNEDEDDRLDFLSINPGRVTRSKGQKIKQSNNGGKGSSNSTDDGDMYTFDFAFGGTNSNESLDHLEDLF
ncbi:uncharacterized protein LOC126562234 [Anopheles maculipalpis]|uniref:uncharacterized protein LOC126562234 n=1 Tax=Anopheles maculipalpis TaxID=1496333 RepID=UPI002159061C|nr:uncharacterized protein LOC126562234 [Anopheles maculipalpis]